MIHNSNEILVKMQLNWRYEEEEQQKGEEEEKDEKQDDDDDGDEFYYYIRDALLTFIQYSEE